MKRYLTLGMLFIGAIAFAESVEDPVATEAWLMQVLTFVSQLKGLGTMAIAAAVTQLVMVGFKTPLASFTGRFRFTLVALLSVVGLVLGAMATGSTLTVALGQAPVLASFQVFISQLWKQVFTEKGDKPALTV